MFKKLDPATKNESTKNNISYGKYKCCLIVFSAVKNEFFFPHRSHRFFLGTEDKTK